MSEPSYRRLVLANVLSSHEALQLRQERKGMTSWVTQLARKVWFRQGTTRTCFMGPYAGLAFEIGPQMLPRLIVFCDAYEPEVTALLEQVLRPGMVAYDVGAHVGIHALYMAKLLRPHGIVYAFEPWRANYECLVRNVARNQRRVAEIVPVPSAVVAHGGVVRLTPGVGDGQHHVSLNGEWGEDVVGTTLDRFWAQTRTPPTLLLVDVEGQELNVMRGAEELLSKCHPKLILEHHGRGRCAELEAWLAARGYTVHELGPRHLYAE